MGEPLDPVTEVFVDERDPSTELYGEDVAMQCGEVEECLVEDVAFAPRRARLLPTFQVGHGPRYAAWQPTTGIAESFAERRGLAGVEGVGDGGGFLGRRVDEGCCRGQRGADTAEVERQFEDVVA